MLIRTLNRVRSVARRYLVTGRFRANPSSIIDRFFGGKDCFFVQVGANDGVTGDPLHNLVKANLRWRGIFIEANDEVFEKLFKNYPAEDRFAFENVAISESDADRCFYYVSQDTVRKFNLDGADTIGSFNRDHVLKFIPRANLDGPIDDYISVKNVRCQTLMSVLHKHHVESIDLFYVDVETYDYHVLKQIDFQQFRPKLILYEHCNLSPSDLHGAEALLTGQGYRLAKGGRDTVAVSRG